jgi:GTP cyclohydrolase II
MRASKIAEANFPTPHGNFRIFGFEDENKTDSALALVLAAPSSVDAPLVRIHSQCLTGDVFGSRRCDCGEQLEFAHQKIGEASVGILIYQLQEGRGIGLMNKLLAYELQDAGRDTVEANHQLGFEADHRDYALCVEILRHFDVSQVRLMSNNPRKFEALQEAGIKIVERMPIEIAPTDDTQHYLRTKKAKLGHMLSTV